MSVTTTEREWIRLWEVKRLTGWERQYVIKLEAGGLLDTRKDLARSKRWYRRSDVMKILKAEGE